MYHGRVETFFKMQNNRRIVECSCEVSRVVLIPEQSVLDVLQGNCPLKPLLIMQRLVHVKACTHHERVVINKTTNHWRAVPQTKQLAR